MAVGDTLSVKAIATSSAGETPAYDYYVDPVYGSDANDGTSPVAPFQTVAKAATAVGSGGGKTVGLMDGNYPSTGLSAAFAIETVFESINRHGAVLSSIYATSPQNITLRKIRVYLDNPDPEPNPDVAPDIIRLTSPQDVIFDDCLIGCNHQLRSKRAIYMNGSKAVRVTIRKCEIDTAQAGISFSAGLTDCVVEDCELHGFVSTPIRIQGTKSSGLIVRRNTIYDQGNRPNDPEWTGSSPSDNGTWEGLHVSLLAVRDCVDLTFEDNIVFNVETIWMQFYGGEFGLTYEYGDVRIKRNLMYDAGAGLYSFILFATDTLRVGPFEIEHNTIISPESVSWDENSYALLRERFYKPTFNVGTLGAFQTGDSCKNNLIIGSTALPSWSNNNVSWVQPEGATGTDNYFVEISANNDPDWIDTQMVPGTAVFRAFDVELAPRPGYTFTPKIGSFIATAGEGGTYVGATAPA